MTLVLEAVCKKIFAPLIAENTLVNCENEIYLNDIFCQDSEMPASFSALKLSQPNKRKNFYDLNVHLRQTSVCVILRNDSMMQTITSAACTRMPCKLPSLTASTYLLQGCRKCGKV